MTVPVGIGGFIDGVVAGDPGVITVTAGEGFPEVDDAVLEVLVIPEAGVVGGVIAVPMLVLEAGERVEVDDGVNFVFGAAIDGTVEDFEAIFDEFEGLHIRFEVAVIDREADAVHAVGGEESGVVFAEEDVEEAVEEAVVAIGSEGGEEGLALEGFRGGESGDEVFHVHPSAEADAFEEDVLAGAGDDVSALGLQEDVVVHIQFLGFLALHK